MISMRAALYTGNPLDTEDVPSIPGIWAEYAPRTNLVWLLFMLQTLLKNRKPETPTAQPQRVALAARSPNAKITNSETAKGKEENPPKLLPRERQTMDLQAGISRLQNTLEDRLKAVLELLDLEHGHEDMCCAGDLVAYAMDSQWLTEQDFH
jgi:serine/threonine-protein kinase haspin